MFNKNIAAKYAEKLMRKPLASELEPSLYLIAEQQARASHEGWMRGKLDKGYVYGPTTNDDPSQGPLTNPLIKPYDELDQQTKDSNIANAIAVIKALRDRDVTFVSFTKVILYSIAKDIHDEWSREKIKSGWRWGPETDKAQKIHRDLVPFEVLAATPELRGDIQYDVDTAKEIVKKMIDENDLFPVITDLSKFNISVATA